MKRYTSWCSLSHGHELLEDDNGPYILHSDHAAEVATVVSQRNAALADVANLGHDYARLLNQCNEYEVERNKLRAELSAALTALEGVRRDAANIWEKCAVIAWNTGMQFQQRYSALEPRDVGSRCASNIRDAALSALPADGGGE